MRILIVNTYYAPEIMGGAEYSVKKLAEQLQKNGNEVAVLCTGEHYLTEEVDGIKVIRIKPHNLCRGVDLAKKNKLVRVIRRTLDIWNPLNVKMVQEEIRRFSPDVLHTNGLYDLSAVVWKVAKDLNVKVVHTLRDYHLMCPFTSLSCKKNRGVCEITPPSLFCRIHRSVNRRNSRLVDVVTAPSKVTLQMLTKSGFFPNAKQVVIPNAIDFSIEKVNRIFQERQKKLCEKTVEIRFVFLGKLSEQKGVRWMLEAFSKVNQVNARLYIAGKGILEDVVLEAEKKDERIKYVGFLTEQEVDKLLSECDILICPSQWQEPFGRVVLDAYKHSMPAIVSDQGALPGLVDNMITGTVVPSGDCDELTRAISSYVSNWELIISQGKAAMKQLQNFSIENQAYSFEEEYEV